MPPAMSLLGYNGNKGQFLDDGTDWQEGERERKVEKENVRQTHIFMCNVTSCNVT